MCLDESLNIAFDTIREAACFDSHSLVPHPENLKFQANVERRAMHRLGTKLAEIVGNQATRNAAFRRHQTARLLHRLGTLLPHWLAGEELVHESRAMEQMCWRELGYPRQPIFDGDLPRFMVTDADGLPFSLSMPKAPVELAVQMATLEPPPLPASSPIGANSDILVSLLRLTPFESHWLLWSYCIRRFGRAIVPVIHICDQQHGCEVLALMCELPVDVVRDAVASRRLHAWGFLDDIGANGEMPALLSGWLSATDQFAEWIEQPYDSDTDLLIALCQAQVSLPASR